MFSQGEIQQSPSSERKTHQSGNPERRGPAFNQRLLERNDVMADKT